LGLSVQGLRVMQRISVVLAISAILALSTCRADGQGVITTVAGNGVGDFGAPGLSVLPPTFPAAWAPLGTLIWVAVDNQGSVYATGSGYGPGLIQVTPQGTLGRSTAINGGLAIDSAGNFFLADDIQGIVQKVSPSGAITTVVGTYHSCSFPNTPCGGFSGDGGPATSAAIFFPQGLAVDSSGNLFIVDAGNNRIRKVSANGTITTVAGNGSFGFSGDGGPATSASLQLSYYHPGLDAPSYLVSNAGIAVDASGNLYIADQYNNRVRKVAASGVITTVAGNGVAGFSGDGGPATSASLNNPAGIAVDSSGNLFISDNNRIREVANGVITTVAGNGASGFSGDGGLATTATLNNPAGVAVDSSGNLFIADAGNSRIRKLSPSGVMSTVAGNGNRQFAGDGGPATLATFANLSNVAADSSGNLFLADTGNARIRKVSANGIASTFLGGPSVEFPVAGGFPTSSWDLATPTGVAADAFGNVFIADSFWNLIWRVSVDGVVHLAAGTFAHGFSGDGGPATAASLIPSGGLAVDSSGNLFFIDGGTRIRKISVDGLITTVAGNGSAGFSGDGGLATAASLNGPFGLAVDASGNLFITDTGNNRIRKVSNNGIISTVAGTGAKSFGGDGGQAASAFLNNPTGVAIDTSGNLYIADAQNNRIRRVSPSGIITTIAGNGTAAFSGDGGPAVAASLDFPRGIALDASGNLLISDNGRIREVLASQSAPSVNAGGIVNGASFGTQVVAPGEIVSLFGADLGPGSVSVTIDGIAAPMFYVSANQINMQVPWEVGTKTMAAVLVTVNGKTGPPRQLLLQPFDPAIFVANGRPAVLNQVGQLITPGSPASSGQPLSIYATGLGAVTPAITTGEPAPLGTLFNTLAPATVRVGGAAAKVSFSGLAPGFAGLYQVNFTMPAGLTTGDQSLILAIGGQQTVSLPLAVK
jgi:uncharacterized protein (TIGR03437 family)